MGYIDPKFFNDIFFIKNKKGQVCTRLGPAWGFLIYAAICMIFCSFLFVFKLLNFSNINFVNIIEYLLTFLIFSSAIVIIWIGFAQKNVITKNTIIFRRSFLYLEIPLGVLRNEIIEHPPEIKKKALFFI